MIASIEGRVVPGAVVSLDDLRWDKRSALGALELRLQFSEAELRAVGERVCAYAAECVASEADYFTSSPDLPHPLDPALFVADPAALSQYLADPFWSREVIIALLEVGRGAQSDPARYLIVDFRGAARRDGETVLSLGADPAREG